MATVEQNLIQILTARYGSQVRQAIHDSIRDCYENMSGRLLTVPKGVYDEEEIYELMDLVTQDGVVYLYVSQTPLAGTSLEDITKWAKLYLSAETTIDAASILDGTISFDKLSSALIQQLKNLDITENSAIIGLAAQISSLSENTTNQLSDISDILNDHENGIESALEELSSLATKISEKVQTFWQTNTPSTPWTTPELKNSHIGDYWYSPETKETKRWSGLAWEKILNDEADSAMRLAASKGKIFVSEPVAPYSIGDLWITSLVPEEGIIKVCTADNESSPFSETHWVSVFQGTGSSALTEFINGAYFDDQLDIDNRLTALTSALGVYISDIRVQYYSSTSPLVLNGGEWSEATPERVSGRYIWTRTALVKTDESVIYRPNISGICISGVDGAPGSVDGEVTNIKYQYYFSSSGLVLEDGEWADAYAPPEDPEDLFLWTRVVVSFSNKADLSTTPVRFFPSEGAQGPPGSIGPIGYTGSTGIQGYTGSKGDLGYTGSRGYVGSQGAPGIDGSDGSPGTPGVTGSQGYTGSKGPEGPVGYTGSKGDKGDAGEQGPQGPQGPIGSIGPDGAQGPPGLDGEDGNDGAPGAQGPIGYTGSMGYTGSRGASGTDGAPGANGDPGPAGPKGDPGTIGPIGYTGSKGDKGDSGSPGTPGSPGAQGAVGYTGSQGLQGGTGPQGDPGRAGYTGSQGRQGDTGYTGSRGFVGSQGVQGVQGIIGLTGSQGIQGPIGYTGSKGDTGLQGLIGYTGSQGPQGIQGGQGPIGYTGSMGYVGSQGIQGFSGSKGDTGDGVAALADWAKAPTKPAYTPLEVGASSSDHNHNTLYLGISAKAADSDKLDGYHVSDFPLLDGSGMQRVKFLDASDANSITDFWVLGTNGASGGSNYPGGGYWYVNTVFFADANQLKQTAYGYLSNEIWTRFRYQGTWYPWTNTALLSMPVGFVYTSIDSTSPATLFGGTWSALPAGRFLRAGTGGAEGGSDTHVHSGPWHGHGLTTAYAKVNGVNGDNYLHIQQISSGGNWYSNNAGNKFTSFVAGGGVLGMAAGLGGNTDGAGNGNTGSASNVPAYYEVYAWRRTA